MTHELVVAGAGNEAPQLYLLQRLIGAKVRSVIGYPGGAAMNLAMERGEAGGAARYSWEAIKSAIPTGSATRRRSRSSSSRSPGIRNCRTCR